MATPTSPGPGYSGGGGYTEAPVEPPRSNRKAIGALVCGLLSIVFGIVFAPLGLILGIVAVVLGLTGRRDGTGRNDGKAVAGLVTGGLGLVISIAVIALLGSFFAKNGKTISDCSKQPTDAAIEACIEQRMGE